MKLAMLKMALKFRFVSLLGITLLSLVVSSYTKSDDGYSDWKTTGCYKGIDFCVKKGEYNDYAKKYKWYVKFRNRYQKQVSFDCVAKESYATSVRTTERHHIDSGEEDETSFLLNESNSIKVYVDKVRLGDEDEGDYLNCDNNRSGYYK